MAYAVLCLCCNKFLKVAAIFFLLEVFTLHSAVVIRMKRPMFHNVSGSKVSSVDKLKNMIS